MLASGNGHTNVVKMLLENNAQVDLQDNKGWTPLMLASQGNHFEVVKMLLKSKANMHMVNNQGASAIDIARHCNHLEMITLFLPNNPEDDNISLESVIKSVQKEPDMFDPPSFMLTSELGNKSSVARYRRKLEKPNLPSFMSTPEQRIMSSVDQYKKSDLPSFLQTPELRIKSSVDQHLREFDLPLVQQRRIKSVKKCILPLTSEPLKGKSHFLTFSP